ncbi:hypothetical protein EPA93_18880 [Ktedonosporobacter rubrisoli]|uniref:HTH luxR-type domain-containing protein n=1 Tax=Ktedonosporobacter rubrisoli TaxID=2509675 RepID=A0A4P6JR83_KTERU|nr:LuxR C-terminal-related transcriptional regulator [Ktedonosporobacter rubrisoli]QBD77948.1 hypothetical protein EPA93_18880 [Ktedonosporobacter rubrisoli]
MPKAAQFALIWSAERNIYEWYKQGSNGYYQLLSTESGPAAVQLLTETSFSFQGRHGHLTLRQESRSRRSGYWYAYRNHGQKTHKKYVGRKEDLTLAHLEKTAQALSATLKGSETKQHISRENAGLIPQASELLSKNKAWQAEQQPDTALTLAQQTTLLFAPKLHPPRLHTNLIARAHLLSRLDASLERKLTLVCAPAGAGKTTLVSQWLAERGQQPHAWISLDTGDNDPVLFWSYVMTACQHFGQTEREQTALTLLRTAPQPSFEQPTLELVLKLFLNELSARSQAGILILDDYHVITAPQLHESLAFLLDHLPESLHLIILTRTEPALPLARLRARGEVCELQATDLRFSQGESQAFLQQTLSFQLPLATIEQLNTHIEGWATGLRLVTLALQNKEDQQEIEHFLANFSGNYRHILEYFVAEVLATQAEPLQSFLLQTSTLTRLTASLCDAVTERNDSEQLLKVFARTNLFLQALDDVGEWYRYHPLFAEAMQNEARHRLGQQALKQCYLRASAWYEQHNQLPEAIEALLIAQQFAQAASLIQKLLGDQAFFCEMAEYHTLYRWLHTLPVAILEQHPQLCLSFATVALFSLQQQSTARIEQIETALQLAEGTFRANNNLSGLGEILAFRSIMAIKLQGNLILTARLAREALAYLPEKAQQWRSTCLRFIGVGEFIAGHVYTAHRYLQEAQAIFEASGNEQAVRAGLFAQGEVCCLQGELHQAAALYRTVYEAAEKVQFFRGKALLGLARLSYEWNALEQAEQETREAIVLGEQYADEPLLFQASLLLMNIEWARGEHNQAQKRLYTLLARSQLKNSPQHRRTILFWQARLALACGDLAATERWATIGAADREHMPGLQQEQEALLLARLKIAQGNSNQALQSLTRWQHKAHQQGRMRSELEILILKALAHFAREHTDSARQQLKEALLYASSQGYIRLFLDEGAPMITMLGLFLPILRKELPTSYLQALLQALAGPQARQDLSLTSNSFAIPQIEPLSAQEQRVLRLLLAGYSNPEIAQTLIVSVNTVKTQVQSIYRKLNISSRKEAREIAGLQH